MQFSKNVCMYNCTMKKPILIFFSKHSVHANVMKSLYTKNLCKASNVNVYMNVIILPMQFFLKMYACITQ